MNNAREVAGKTLIEIMDCSDSHLAIVAIIESALIKYRNDNLKFLKQELDDGVNYNRFFYKYMRHIYAFRCRQEESPLKERTASNEKQT